ncbi:unnamed protein product [Polarella glacialis]|uniref:Uncharacterized protein n=1 Tax=Polarella glacialis TaxID=89957 RepID=A0A813F5T5_POLGL|nr:unnamed protein product [Polarella glacialis]
MDLFRYATIRDFTDERVVMCCEELEEAENDIFGLATSFLLVQVARYCITGVLPNAEGEERPFHPHGMTSAFLLIGMGAVCLVLGILLAFVPIGNKKLKHVSETMQNTLGMVFAWAVLVGARMVSREWAPLVQLVGDYATMRRLTIALTLSTCAITVIGALDLISDRLSGRDAKQLARVLQNMINVLSILIGLSWEACFESGVAELAQVSGDPERTTLLLSVGTIMVVVPAWRKHILERVQVLNRKFSERREALQTHGLEEDAEEEDKASPRQETEGSSRPLIQGKTKI